ncbi:hypothetical protein Tco_1496177 [Tanacetum coccineum]
MTGSDDKIPTPPPSPKSSSDKLIPFGVTSITNNVPVKLDLEKMNYNSWSSFFKIHLGSIGLKDHIESDTVSSSNKEWSRLNDLVKNGVWLDFEVDFMAVCNQQVVGLIVNYSWSYGT